METNFEMCVFNKFFLLILKFSAPTVDREVIDVGLACIAKLEDKYYRLQITSFDITEDCCDVKFLDYDLVKKSNLDANILNKKLVTCFLFDNNFFK